MLLLISPEQTSKTEIATLHKLFEAGLQYFHFRKPTANLEEHRAFLAQLDPQYYQYIMTHNFHRELCDEFELKGIHMEEANWIAQEDNLASYVKEFNEKGFVVSSSYHEPEDITSQLVAFEYHLLSPLFTAISKRGIKGRGFDVRHIAKFIAGMGGINAQTIPEAMRLGFKGVGTLGGVWNASDPIASFKEMKAVLDSHI